jgi:outer membrane protein assembly factor BamB
MADAVYTVSNDGIVHALNVSNGSDLVDPVQFLPEMTMPTGLTLIDGTLYAVVANGCGTTPNGVWAIDLPAPKTPVTSWKTNGGNVAGFVGPTFGADGTLYVAVGAGESTGTTSYSNSIVALEPKTLRVKSAFRQANADFNSAPVVLKYKDQGLIAATGNDGKMYLLSTASMSAPLSVTTAYGALTSSAGSLSAYQDLQGTWWLFAATAGPLQGATRFPVTNGAVTNGAMVAFKVVDVEGKAALQPAWVSRDLTSPLAPIVVNGVLFAASSGEFHTTDARLTPAQRAQRSRPAVLYAIDPATGKDIWNSGSAITSFARRGLSSHNSEVFIVTYDNTVYTYGIPVEK